MGRTPFPAFLRRRRKRCASHFLTLRVRQMIFSRSLRWIVAGLLIVCVVSVISITTSKRLWSERNAKNFSDAVLSVAILSALGHSNQRNPYKILARGYGHDACNYWTEECSGVLVDGAILPSHDEFDRLIDAARSPCKYLNSNPAVSKNENIVNSSVRTSDEWNETISRARKACNGVSLVEKIGNDSTFIPSRVFIGLYERGIPSDQVERIFMVIEIRLQTNSKATP